MILPPINGAIEAWLNSVNRANYLILTFQIFEANYDKSTAVKQRFFETVFAQYIRVHPQTYGGEGVGLRMEIYGCHVGR